MYTEIIWILFVPTHNQKKYVLTPQTCMVACQPRNQKKTPGPAGRRETILHRPQLHYWPPFPVPLLSKNHCDGVPAADQYIF